MTPTTTLSAVVHADSKVGKTWFSATMPGPRLYLDIESRAKFAPLGRRVTWEPQHPVPADVDEDTTVMCKINEINGVTALDTVYQWLAAGQHPFKSLIFDSITELQKRYMDVIAGANAMQTQHWGELLRKVETSVRRMRDLADTTHIPPINVLFICGSDDRSGIWRPMLQGALARTLPYHVDLFAYMATCVDPTDPAVLTRQLHLQPTGNFAAGDGTDILSRAYGPAIVNPSFTAMLQTLDNFLGVSA